MANSPGIQNTVASNTGLFSGPSAAVLPAVCMVTTVVCGPLVPLSVTVGGWKLQVAFWGRLVQENCSVPE